MVDYRDINDGTPLVITTPINQKVAGQIINQWSPQERHRTMTMVDMGHRNSRSRLNAYVIQYVKGKVCYNYGQIGFDDPIEATEFQLRYVHEW